MLRPASLLPALSQAFDAPLWLLGSLPTTGACYRALRRLPRRIFHPLEERVFQDAPCLDSSAPASVIAGPDHVLPGSPLPLRQVYHHGTSGVTRSTLTTLLIRSMVSKA